jgi:hypothetical protein
VRDAAEKLRAHNHHLPVPLDRLAIGVLEDRRPLARRTPGSAKVANRLAPSVKDPRDDGVRGPLGFVGAGALPEEQRLQLRERPQREGAPLLVLGASRFEPDDWRRLATSGTSWSDGEMSTPSTTEGLRLVRTALDVTNPTTSLCL